MTKSIITTRFKFRLACNANRKKIFIQFEHTAYLHNSLSAVGLSKPYVILNLSSFARAHLLYSKFMFLTCSSRMSQ